MKNPEFGFNPCLGMPEESPLRYVRETLSDKFDS